MVVHVIQINENGSTSCMYFKLMKMVVQFTFLKTQFL